MTAHRRRACKRKGHRFAEFEGVNLPVIFCRRWFCKASIPAPWVPEPLRSALALCRCGHNGAWHNEPMTNGEPCCSECGCDDFEPVPTLLDVSDGT